MPRFDRTVGRNVHIYDAGKRDVELGGLVLPPDAPSPVTRRVFWGMVEILVAADGEYRIVDAEGTVLPVDDESLTPGNYYIATEDPLAHVAVSTEPVIVRMISHGTGPRVRAFTEAVRARDNGCVISGEPVTDGDFDIFQAAHIFPLSHERYWKDNLFSRWISIFPPTGGAINSVQNGMLLRNDVHSHFDTYAVSINPDDDYRIVWFRKRYGMKAFSGTLPRQMLLDDRRPSKELLRWHFRQAVLANMRGAGEPVFEHDFPPGSDRMGTILDGPKAAEMMEAELFGRFALQMDLNRFDTVREAMEERCKEEGQERQGNNDDDDTKNADAEHHSR